MAYWNNFWNSEEQLNNKNTRFLQYWDIFIFCCTHSQLPNYWESTGFDPYHGWWREDVAYDSQTEKSWWNVGGGETRRAVTASTEEKTMMAMLSWGGPLVWWCNRGCIYASTVETQGQSQQSYTTAMTDIGRTCWNCVWQWYVWGGGGGGCSGAGGNNSGKDAGQEGTAIMGCPPLPYWQQPGQVSWC